MADYSQLEIYQNTINLDRYGNYRYQRIVEDKVVYGEYGIWYKILTEDNAFDLSTTLIRLVSEREFLVRWQVPQAQISDQLFDGLNYWTVQSYETIGRRGFTKLVTQLDDRKEDGDQGQESHKRISANIYK